MYIQEENVKTSQFCLTKCAGFALCSVAFISCQDFDLAHVLDHQAQFQSRWDLVLKFVLREKTILNIYRKTLTPACDMNLQYFASHTKREKTQDREVALV